MPGKSIFCSVVLIFVFCLVVTGCGDNSDDADDDAGGGDGGMDTDTDTDTGDDPDTDYDLDAGPDSGSSVSHVSIEMIKQAKTVLNVRWTQTKDADSAWLKYTFENDEWFESPTTSAAAGEHEQVILGVPGETEVTFHVVTETGGVTGETAALTASTGAVPQMMPRPTVESYDAALASPNRWLYGSVDDTQDENSYYSGPFWIYIIDRQGRIVWYYSNIGDNPIIGFPRISRDGRYIFFGNRTPWSEYSYSTGWTPSVVKMTLDWKYFEEIEIPLADNVDMTDEGTLLFDTFILTGESKLKEYLPNGTLREIWDCSPVMGDYCYSNTVNWNPLDDTILMSFPYPNTVLEIDRQSGEIVGRYGNGEECYSFVPDSWGFSFQHYANITPEGTLMVSSHILNEDKHAFMEFDIDRQNETLTEKWIYDLGNEWASAMGEAHKVLGGEGNVLANYGTGGVIREITPDMQTAWYVKWDAPFPDEHYNKMVGHCTLLDDLYAINQGPE